MTTSISRATAVTTVAGHIADRDAFVITVPPNVLGDVTHGLRDVDGWTAYLDSGTPVILQTDRVSVLAVTGAIILSAAVVTVPKTVPAAVLSKALGQTIPDDGSQDLVVLHGADGEPIVWPLLFVDALDQVDPIAAAQLRAAHTPHLN